MVVPQGPQQVYITRPGMVGGRPPMQAGPPGSVARTGQPFLKVISSAQVRRNIHIFLMVRYCLSRRNWLKVQ